MRLQSTLRLAAQRSMRQADVTRNTSETKIQIAINLDGTGKAELATGVPFLD